jgi:spore maturation protein CgeB
MKVLIVSLKFELNSSSFTESYFEKPIKNLGHIVLPYDFMGRYIEIGRNAMNLELLEIVKRERPNITLFVPYQNEFIPEIIDEMNNHTITIGYFFDDSWRKTYSHFWAEHYRFVTTSSINGINLWRNRGCDNFIYSPFACNNEDFKKIDTPKKYDVSFVGGYHPYRSWCLQKLRCAGINVNVWGSGWKAGALNQEEMIQVFNQSKINLNLSNNESFDLRFVFNLSRPLLESLRVAKKTFTTLIRQDAKTFEMVKARHFEITSCGGFQLSYYVEGLEQHYQIGQEIELYQSSDEMIEKIKYFLKNEGERECIATKGYKRSLKDHNLTQRFRKLFDEIEAYRTIQ